MVVSVEAYRIQFFETVKTIWEDSFFYTYFTEEKDIGFQKREFEYLPPYNIVEKRRENLTEEEKSVLKKLVKSLREEAAKNRR